MPNGFSHHVLHKTLTGLVLWCCLSLLPTAVHSATTNSATLQWAANAESDLAGYKVYQGTTVGSYGPGIDVGTVTTYTASNLQTGLTYYFAVTAYDTSGNQSPPSIEVSMQIPATAFTRSIVPLNKGIAASDRATGSGYILYSAESVHNRFAAQPPYRSNSVHLIAVQFSGGVWTYNNNVRFVGFTPRASDVLIATVNFSADTITGLQGVNGVKQGIAKGYASGDLTFTPNLWGGRVNAGEFTVGGTAFVTN